ncbi:MAG: phosphatidate cytidylyltransferase [Thermoprotei archaeon]|nr:MAG: phosphatidate cytidylyltransferase [Thermoprotei archaeon]
MSGKNSILDNPWFKLSLLILVFIASSATVMYLWFPSFIEIVWGGILVIWVLLVVFRFSKLVSRKWNKYVARKFIHFLTGGLVAIIAPYIFEVPTIPVLGALFMAIVTVAPRIWKKDLDWFQIKNNFGDTWFCLSFALLFLTFWYIDKWIAITAALFMSIGDGITGIVRNRIYRRHVKGFWGSVAMLVVSVIIGVIYKGVLGVLTAIVATIVERIPLIDDNITVPLISAGVMYFIPVLLA